MSSGLGWKRPRVRRRYSVGLQIWISRREVARSGAAGVGAPGDASILALRAEALKVNLLLEYSHPMVGTRVVEVPWIWHRRTGGARAHFGFLEWAEELRKRGLAQGPRWKTPSSLLPDRILSPLHFADEFARHKILDMIEIWRFWASARARDRGAVVGTR